jgi:hypothetical protein
MYTVDMELPGELCPSKYAGRRGNFIRSKGHRHFGNREKRADQKLDESEPPKLSRASRQRFHKPPVRAATAGLEKLQQTRRSHPRQKVGTTQHGAAAAAAPKGSPRRNAGRRRRHPTRPAAPHAPVPAHRRGCPRAAAHAAAPDQRHPLLVRPHGLLAEPQVTSSPAGAGAPRPGGSGGAAPAIVEPTIAPGDSEEAAAGSGTALPRRAGGPLSPFRCCPLSPRPPAPLTPPTLLRASTAYIMTRLTSAMILPPVYSW